MWFNVSFGYIILSALYSFLLFSFLCMYQLLPSSWVLEYDFIFTHERTRLIYLMTRVCGVCVCVSMDYFGELRE